MSETTMTDARAREVLGALRSLAGVFAETKDGGNWLVRPRHAADVIAVADLALGWHDALQKIDAACREVAPDNDAATVGTNSVDEHIERYLIIGDSGTPLLEADDPADVVRQLNQLWAEVSERFAPLAAGVDRLRSVHVAERIHPWDGEPYDVCAKCRVPSPCEVIRTLDGTRGTSDA